MSHTCSMNICSPDSNRIKTEPNQCSSDYEDDFSEYLKNGNQEVESEKKKRRGKIEKRRRDKINNSISALKELVPSASAKQNTTKLEKAEILKLTVDYLKERKDKDLRSAYGNYSNNVEQRVNGFRDCMNEVSRYLLHREGISATTSLYMGLMDHLQYFTRLNYNSTTHSHPTEPVSFNIQDPPQSLMTTPSILNNPYDYSKWHNSSNVNNYSTIPFHNNIHLRSSNNPSTLPLSTYDHHSQFMTNTTTNTSTIPDMSAHVIPNILKFNPTQSIPLSPQSAELNNALSLGTSLAQPGLINSSSSNLNGPNIFNGYYNNSSNNNSTSSHYFSSSSPPTT